MATGEMDAVPYRLDRHDVVPHVPVFIVPTSFCCLLATPTLFDLRYTLTYILTLDRSIEKHALSSQYFS